MTGSIKPQAAIPYIWKTMLLTASIITVSVAVSLAIIAVRGDGTRPLSGMAETGFREAYFTPPYPADPADPEYAEPLPPEAALPTELPPLEDAISLLPPTIAPPEMPPRPDRRTLVFVIDDAGHNLHQLEPFLRFPGPLTIAVLPGLPYTVEAARRIREAGHEVFLHQPMEALGGEDPGPGAIYLWMSNDEILEILGQNLEEVGPVSGMNNHMGSRITASERIMEIVLAFSREHGIPFLDSKTNAASVAPTVARRMGITIGERNVFIDNQQTRSYMNRTINDGRRIASRRGTAVMIGHIWSPELAPLLKDLYQYLVDQGYTFATASQLINGDF